MQEPRLSPASLRGSVLVFVLLLTTLFFLLGVAMVSQSQGAMKTTQATARAAEARALAWAGLADARGKLARILYYPPPGGDAQDVFAYTEEVRAVDSTTVVGSYNVIVDVRTAKDPYYLLRIRSEGVLGERTRPAARSIVQAEIDARTFELLRLQYRGAP